ncbi:MAG: phospho-sugar mutase, partial [Paramuribaculum sp.]|nr:phospho-sugar mutase [Paramuribaculum sp.]
LKRAGVKHLLCEPQQMVIDGNFPTVDSPNPENASAMAMAIAKAKETGADLVVASDPDADRIGAVIRDAKGEYVLINGNQIVMILLYYIITRNKELGRLKGNEFIVKTIVTTETIKSIADKNDVKMFDVYTGFKWIAAVIRDLEGVERYLGGGEESYGFLAEDFCRDKDSVSAISLMAEIAAWAKDKDMDFLAMLQDIYMKYGFSKECGISVTRPGKSGAEEIQAMMVNFRANPPKSLGGSAVTIVKDYGSLELTDVAAGTKSKLDMPVTSNVLQYFTADGTKVSIRPSGTEPKIKFYIEVKGSLESAADYDRANADAEAKIEAVKADLGI